MTEGPALAIALAFAALAVQRRRPLFQAVHTRANGCHACRGPVTEGEWLRFDRYDRVVHEACEKGR